MRTSSSLFNQGLIAKVKSAKTLRKHFLTLKRQEKGLFLIMLMFASVALPLSYNISIYSSAIMFMGDDVGFLIFCRFWNVCTSSSTWCPCVFQAHPPPQGGQFSLHPNAEQILSCCLGLQYKMYFIPIC